MMKRFMSGLLVLLLAMTLLAPLGVTALAEDAQTAEEANEESAEEWVNAPLGTLIGKIGNVFRSLFHRKTVEPHLLAEKETWKEHSLKNVLDEFRSFLRVIFGLDKGAKLLEDGGDIIIVIPEGEESGGF